MDSNTTILGASQHLGECQQPGELSELQVPTQVTQLDKEVARLLNIVSALETHLTPVLHPSVPTPPKQLEQSEHSPPLVPLAESLCAIVLDTRLAAEKLESIHRRLEV